MTQFNKDLPNIILIIADQMRGDCLGADGHPVVETPNLDWLAKSGTRFSHAYSPVPSCLPARAILMTGMNQWHTGVLGMGRGQGVIPNDYPHTLAGELSKAGYATHLVGKGHFTPQRASMGFQTRELDESGRLIADGQKDDYREWFDREKKREITPDDHGVDWNSWMARPWHTEEYLHPTSWTMTRAQHFLRERDKSRPFFLNISFARPHSPYVPPQPYFDLYDGREMPSPHIGEWSAMHEVPGAEVNVNAWRGKLSDWRIQRGRVGYYGEISFIDAQIGRLRNWMSRYQPELNRNTWIIFTADHGDMVGDHHLWRKTYAYEGSARVPLIVAPPPGTRVENRVAEEVAGLQDIMPTILDAAGVEIPASVDGNSLISVMKGDASSWREYLHGEHCTCYAPEQEMQYVTDGRRKFIWLPRIGVEQFFDLVADPGETRNLVDDAAYAVESAMWRARLVAELEARDCGWVRDGALHCPDDGSPLVSPYKELRYGV
ncbi:MAG: arylsulfatase [Candidatus Poribacteria bacterium]|nr:arylsulfatase [Candidatus Poribacteria bacterium]